MSRTEQDAYLKGAVEALLFVSDEPVSAARLSTFLDVSPSRVDELLGELAAELEESDRGMQLREVAGGWRLYSHPAYHDIIERYIISWDTRRMSQAALEALAVIAYHQPVTRAGVNAIRGVNSEAVISSLVEKGLVREVGREKAAGAAILYGTTRTFLEKFGLKNLADLPPLEDFAPDEESRLLIRERLSGSGRAQLTDELDLEGDGSVYELTLTDETGEPVGVEEVDRGEDVREDDPEAMAAIISASMTEKTPDLEEGVGAAGDDPEETFASASAQDHDLDDDDEIITVD